jgi:signal transduction histidine kinase
VFFGLKCGRAGNEVKHTFYNRVFSPTEHDKGSASPWCRGPLSKQQLFWILQSCGWIAFGLAMFRWGLDFMSARDALVNKVLLVSLGFTLTCLFRLLFREFRKHVHTPVLAVVCILVVAFVGAAAWSEIHSWLFQAYSSLIETGEFEVELVSIPLGTLLYDGFVLFAWSLLYFVINNWIDLEDQRKRALKAEATAHAARLRALQSQIEPHFLFNALNAISTLVVEGRSVDATRMIARLSEFLRLTLAASDTPEISVADELHFARLYLEIEQVRFGQRLRVTIDAQPEAMGGLVPALVLQPLVENAVKHGVLRLEEGGLVQISAVRRKDTLRLAVVDNGVGITKDPAHGIGLSNTIHRLRELYRDRAQFSLRSHIKGGAEVILEIPFRTEGQLRGRI